MGEKLDHSEFDESKKPLLSLKYTQDGLFSGYITHLKDMKHIFVTENYDYVTKMNTIASNEVKKPLANIKAGDLALLRLVHTFTRVRILKTISKSKSQVLLIDTGHEINIENLNLFEITDNLSLIPPLAIAVEISYKEIYPEALDKDLIHLVGENILFELDENKKANIVRIKNVSIFNSYLKTNITYHGSIVHSDWFKKNITYYSPPPTVTFVHNSVAPAALPSYKQRVTSPTSVIIPVLVFFMIFGSIGFIVAKFLNDKKKTTAHSTTITIRPSPRTQEKKNNFNNSTKQTENDLIQGKQQTQAFGEFQDNRADVEARTQTSTVSPSQAARTNQLFLENEQNDERLQAGISMLSSIHQRSIDHGHYYSSSADTTFNNALDHVTQSSRGKTFPKRSTPINGSVKSSASTSSELAYATSYSPEELSQSGIIASFANTHDMFQNLTSNSSSKSKSMRKKAADDSFHSSTSR